MSLYKDWEAIAQSPRDQREYNEFWQGYFELEKQNYIKILENHERVINGKLATLAEEFGMTAEQFCGFIDGANTSFKNGEYDLESLEAESDISLEFDFEKLFFNMLNAKADWLYELPQWDGILTTDRRAEITKEFRASKIFHAEKNVGRNDPCPCGSGKKYKKCCGKDA